MLYQWVFRPYRRRFKQVLQTSYGDWAMREGILLRMMDEAGHIGWGEIAPIPWFSSETLEQALAFCHQLPSELSDNLIFSLPDTLPSCQFGFESAWEMMLGPAIDLRAPFRDKDAHHPARFATQHPTLPPQHSALRSPSSDIEAQNTVITVQHSTLRPQHLAIGDQHSAVAVQNSKLSPQHSTLGLHPTPHSLSHSALLPAGEAALHAWKALWDKGFRTFKWKIGVQPIATELRLLHSLTQCLPASAKLRLDANGGLSLNEAAHWLETCDAIALDPSLSATLEYLEQPLSVSQFQAMQHLSDRYTTPIALDESVATLQQLQTCYKNGWRGIFVIKAAIAGSPTRLRQFCQEQSIDAVFSSGFETAIGRQAGLRLAAAFGNPDRAMGYGLTHWLEDAETTDFEQLWQTL